MRGWGAPSNDSIKTDSSYRSAIVILANLPFVRNASLHRHPRPRLRAVYLRVFELRSLHLPCTA